MIKIKPIVFSACAAFVLSFVIAIASKSGFAASLLKAAFFGLLFGGIAVGVQFVYSRFLAEGNAPAEAAEEPKAMGSRVDLVVSEEDLPDDKDAPAFYVEGKHVLSNEDVGSPSMQAKPSQAKPAASAEPAAEAFSAAEQNKALEAAEKVREQKAAENIVQKAEDVPVDVGVPQAQEAQPAFSPVSLAAGAVSANAAASTSDELDDLPDIGDIGGVSSAEAQEDGVIEDSEFAEEGMAHVSRQTELSDGRIVDVKDAPVMAEAIRTILKTEE